MKPELVTPFPTLRLFGLEVAVLSLEETVAWIWTTLQHGRHLTHADINTFKVVQMNDLPGLRESVAASDFISADGMGIVWAARLMGKKLPGRVTGIDLMMHLVERAGMEGKKIYLLGAKPEVVQQLSEIYQNQYGKNFIAGFRDGYFSDDQAPEIAREISSCQPDLLFVGMTSPRKENFLHNQAAILEPIPYKMGVGGSFDVLSGMIPRAPIWIQRMGLEWLFRLSREPRRLLKRYTVDNFRFLMLLLREWKTPL